MQVSARWETNIFYRFPTWAGDITVWVFFISVWKYLPSLRFLSCDWFISYNFLL